MHKKLDKKSHKLQFVGYTETITENYDKVWDEVTIGGAR